MTTSDAKSRVATLMQDYQALRKSLPDLPELTLVELGPPSRTTAAADEAACLPDRGAEGWVRFRSDFLVIHADGDWPDLDQQGEAVWGEWRVEGEESTRYGQLRPDDVAPGKLARTVIAAKILHGSEEAGAGGFPALRQSLRVPANPVPEGGDENTPCPALEYHVFWGVDIDEEPHATRRLFWRFAGFVEARLIHVESR